MWVAFGFWLARAWERVRHADRSYNCAHVCMEGAHERVSIDLSIYALLVCVIDLTDRCSIDI